MTLITERLVILLCIFSMLTITSVALADNQQKKRAQLKKQITNAQSSLSASRSVSAKLRKKVEEAEDKLHKISKKLHHTEKKINKLTSKLAKSNIKKNKLIGQTQQQKEALAQQMQALYTSGTQSHLRLLLRQDNPSEISRTVKYFEYMNKHRLARIKNIKTSLSTIETLQNEINTDTITLNALKEKQSLRKKELKVTAAARGRALRDQKKVVRSKEQELAKLKRQEQQLNNVIKKLTLKRQAEENKRQQNKITSTNKNNRASQSKPTSGKNISRHFVPNKPFSSLRGKLSWPVKGRLTERYGTNRNTKQKWKGVVISAPAGTNVHAVARGKIEFSGRLRGYGYLVIIRHDKNYRSLYAYNQSVYKKVGQIVKAGDIIAAVGSSGGQSNSGLYFEIRKGTSHHNPSRWCR